MQNRIRIVVVFILLLISNFSISLAQSGSSKPFMGVTVDTTTAALRKQNNLKLNQGLQVLAVSENSSAKAAGILVGDVLVGLNDSTIRSTPQFISLVQSHKVGETVKLTFYRDGKKKAQPVVLRARASTELK